jgi:hypothetical protein
LEKIRSGRSSSPTTVTIINDPLIDTSNHLPHPTILVDPSHTVRSGVIDLLSNLSPTIKGKHFPSFSPMSKDFYQVSLYFLD